MFLDSGNIISDETFYTQSQTMVEKIPEFSAESLCLRHVTPTATSYHPLMKAERFCRKFGNFFRHYLTLSSVCRMFRQKHIGHCAGFRIYLATSCHDSKPGTFLKFSNCIKIIINMPSTYHIHWSSYRWNFSLHGFRLALGFILHVYGWVRPLIAQFSYSRHICRKRWQHPTLYLSEFT